MKIKYIVAVKDASKDAIKQGKVLGEFRELQFAKIALPRLIENSGVQYFRIGIFYNGKLIN